MRGIVISLVLAAGAAFAGPAQAQGTLGRAPDWAERLAFSDIAPTTGGRASLIAEGVQVSVRATIAPYQGGVARVVRVDGRADNATQLFLRRFTGHPNAGWWIWGPDTPWVKPVTAAQRAEIERLARSALALGAGGADPLASCPNGERAFIEVAIGTRSTSLSRDCIGSDPVSQLATLLSTLAGSRDEQELHEAAVAELLDADRAFNAMAQEDGVAAAFAHYAADSAHQFAPGQDPAAGRDAVAAFWAQWPEGGTLVWEPQYAQVSERGDMGWTWGRGVSTIHGVRTASRYVTVWKRDYEGNWRFVADIGNQDPRRSQAPATPPSTQPGN